MLLSPAFTDELGWAFFWLFWVLASNFLYFWVQPTQHTMLKGEAQMQSSLINYVKYQYPSLLYCASAGGMFTSMKQAIKMKATGYVKGFPDLLFLEPTTKYHGLFIELKTEKGVLSKEQKWWLQELRKRNYIAEACYGFEHAKKVIDMYMSGKV